MEDKFFELLRIECQKNGEQYDDIRSLHEGLGLLEEEFHEVRLEIFKKVTNREELLKELLQVAGLCVKIASNCKLL